MDVSLSSVWTSWSQVPNLRSRLQCLLRPQKHHPQCQALWMGERGREKTNYSCVLWLQVWFHFCSTTMIPKKSATECAYSTSYGKYLHSVSSHLLASIRPQEPHKVKNSHRQPAAVLYSIAASMSAFGACTGWPVPWKPHEQLSLIHGCLLELEWTLSCGQHPYPILVVIVLFNTLQTYLSSRMWT